MRTKGKESIRNMVLSGLFIALGVALPLAFHGIANAGKIFLPMHLPVLILAFLVPWQYALAVGVITPLLSSVITGMPPIAPFPMAIIMAFELGMYGLVIALLKKATKRIQNPWFATLATLVPAQICGRIVAGLVVFVSVSLFSVKGPGFLPFITGGIVTGLPGIAAQIVLIPLILQLVQRVIGNPKQGKELA